MKNEVVTRINMKATSQAAGRRLSKFRPHTSANKKKLASKKACRGNKFDVV